MKVLDNQSPEVIHFFRSLEQLSAMVKTTLRKRTPHLNGEKYLTNKDLSELLHISERSLQDYRDTGILPYFKISGKVYYRESDIIKLLEDNYYEAFGPTDVNT